MIESIEQIHGAPIISKAYKVPAVNVVDSEYASGYIPVIGPLHEDAGIIGFLPLHWHIDFRFLSDRQLQKIIDWNWDVSAIMTTVIHKNHTTGMVDIVRRRCRRAMPEFPIAVLNIFGQAKKSPFGQRLERAFENHQIKTDCAVCPHRGIKLDGLPQNDAGEVVCPGHGLKWSLRTGKMVRRFPVADVEVAS